MKTGRFIIVVLDGFGIGAMDDVAKVRPQDLGANTALKLIDYKRDKHWETLLELGLMNAICQERPGFEKVKTGIFSSSNLKHFGADTYFGHQEISGTNPKKPKMEAINSYLDVIQKDLENEGFEVERVSRAGNQLLKINNMICVGDNMETDLGQAINVVGALDYSGWEMIKEVGSIVRRNVHVARVIAFGGSDVTIERILDNIVTKGEFIGIDAPESGVYDNNYHVVHIGHGVDTSKQMLIKIKEAGFKNRLYGKVADIVFNPDDYYRPGVDTAEILDTAIADIKENDQGLFFINVQETDLSGHSQDPDRYIDVINIANPKIKKIMNLMNDEDILVVMADHGNDPFIGHSRHTRERVPLLIKVNNNSKLIDLGVRDTMSDVGATAADYFHTSIEHGTSFLKELKRKYDK